MHVTHKGQTVKIAKDTEQDVAAAIEQLERKAPKDTVQDRQELPNEKRRKPAREAFAA